MKVPSLFLALLLAGCVTTAHEARWEASVCFEAKGAIERIRCGRPDASDPDLQAVSVDQAGEVALMHFHGGVPSSEVIYRNGVELTGLAIGDLDPEQPGVEIYVSGWAHNDQGQETGGAVYQIVLGEPTRVRQLFAAPVYIHSLEILPGARLLVSTYQGEIHELTPGAGLAPWTDRILHAEGPLADPEAPKIKDVGLLAEPGGAPRHRALVAMKAGRLLYIDLDRPEEARLVHEESGGLSRITPDADGGAYVTGYAGRLMHWTSTEGEWKYDVLDQEGVDSGLRGAVIGRFPAGEGVAQLVVFGFHKLCRALVPRLGVLDPVTLYVDLDRGHTIEAADLVPGNDADELLVGGYSKRVTLLVARSVSAGSRSP
ncbi:MAG: hypothetical protein IPJ19_01395 [Planctomycetes bacterium]|nr:hypothetical protein [Planctomycetota bacterium]